MEIDMLTDIQNKENCCGCQACVQICGRNCIQMQPDNEGFCYPVVDKEQCVSCGLCEQACPIICKEKQDKKTEPFAEAYIAINKNTIIREKSSSGGIFYLLAKEIIEQQGVVYGAAFTEEFEVEHTGVCNLDDLRKILGSKYVQSSTGNVFSEIKQHLKNGKTVLFSGTPC